MKYDLNKALVKTILEDNTDLMYIKKNIDNHIEAYASHYLYHLFLRI